MSTTAFLLSLAITPNHGADSPLPPLTADAQARLARTFTHGFHDWDIHYGLFDGSLLPTGSEAEATDHSVANPHPANGIARDTLPDPDYINGVIPIPDLNHDGLGTDDFRAVWIAAETLYVTDQWAIATVPTIQGVCVADLSSKRILSYVHDFGLGSYRGTIPNLWSHVWWVLCYSGGFVLIADEFTASPSFESIPYDQAGLVGGELSFYDRDTHTFSSNIVGWPFVIIDPDAKRVLFDSQTFLQFHYPSGLEDQRSISYHQPFTMWGDQWHSLLLAIRDPAYNRAYDIPIIVRCDGSYELLFDSQTISDYFGESLLRDRYAASTAFYSHQGASYQSQQHLCLRWEQGRLVILITDHISSPLTPGAVLFDSNDFPFQEPHFEGDLPRLWWSYLIYDYLDTKQFVLYSSDPTLPFPWTSSSAIEKSYGTIRWLDPATGLVVCDDFLIMLGEKWVQSAEPIPQRLGEIYHVQYLKGEHRVCITSDQGVYFYNLGQTDPKARKKALQKIPLDRDVDPSTLRRQQLPWDYQVFFVLWSPQILVHSPGDKKSTTYTFSQEFGELKYAVPATEKNDAWYIVGKRWFAYLDVHGTQHERLISDIGLLEPIKGGSCVALASTFGSRDRVLHLDLETGGILFDSYEYVGETNLRPLLFQSLFSSPFPDESAPKPSLTSVRGWFLLWDEQRYLLSVGEKGVVISDIKTGAVMWSYQYNNPKTARFVPSRHDDSVFWMWEEAVGITIETGKIAWNSYELLWGPIDLEAIGDERQIQRGNAWFFSYYDGSLVLMSADKVIRIDPRSGKLLFDSHECQGDIDYMKDTMGITKWDLFSDYALIRSIVWSHQQLIDYHDALMRGDHKAVQTIIDALSAKPIFVVSFPQYDHNGGFYHHNLGSLPEHWYTVFFDEVWSDNEYKFFINSLLPLLWDIKGANADAAIYHYLAWHGIQHATGLAVGDPDGWSLDAISIDIGDFSDLWHTTTTEEIPLFDASFIYACSWALSVADMPTITQVYHQTGVSHTTYWFTDNVSAHRVPLSFDEHHAPYRDDSIPFIKLSQGDDWGN